MYKRTVVEIKGKTDNNNNKQVIKESFMPNCEVQMESDFYPELKLS